MTEQERQQLDRDGYVVLEDAMGAALLRELREAIHVQFDREGERAGHEFKTEENARRLANLVNKGEVFRRAILLPRMIEVGPRLFTSTDWAARKQRLPRVV